MVTDRAFIFHMCMPNGKTVFFATKVKLKYHDPSLQNKVVVAGAFVFHTHTYLL